MCFPLISYKTGKIISYHHLTVAHSRPWEFDELVHGYRESAGDVDWWLIDDWLVTDWWLIDWLIHLRVAYLDSQFSLCTMWVSGIELRLPGLATSTFTSPVISKALKISSFNPPRQSYDLKQTDTQRGNLRSFLGSRKTTQPGHGVSCL